ncbi:HipA domain-containing protein [Flavobacteriaceae bacterium AH-315-B10]|nr:HipA domain-containing protein [Flavobacteriaceae bacterium AH-315-B10]
MTKKKNRTFKHVSKLPVLKYSGFSPRFDKIEVAKKHNYCVIKGVSVTGDAPKDIIRYYNYGSGFKRKPKSWPIYIAKLGHKYYPLESITEQLISDIGKWFDFNLAESKICSIGGQIRFLSKYFIEVHTDELHHGADMYAGYLHDKQFVDDIELQRMTQSFFTISFTKDVLTYFFKDSFNEIYESFMLMLFFDALIGNNDRHMYNWGVIRDIYGEKVAKFSPIYDSARGLLWNEKESKIFDVLNTKNRKEEFVEIYCNKSKPKIGIENKENVNHFDLIKSYNSYYINNVFIQKLFKENRIETVIENFNTNYNTLISNERRSLITDILKYRFKKLKKIVF